MLSGLKFEILERQIAVHRPYAGRLGQGESTSSATARSDRGRIVMYYAAFLIVFVYTAVLLAVRERFPTNFDELPHYSYVSEMARAPTLFPNYAAMHLLDPTRLTRFTAKPNYLNHPAIYYLLLSPILRFAPGTVLPLRLANVAMASLGVTLLFLTAASRLKTVSENAVFAGLVTGFPKLAELASNVNNDNLAFLGGAIVVTGLLRDRRDLRSACIVGCGLTVGAFAKLTAALMLGLLILGYYLPSLRSGPRAPFIALSLSAVIGSLPFLGNILRFGSPIWEASALAHGAAPGTVLAALPATQFLRMFFETFAEQWAALGRSDWVELAGAGATLTLFAGSLANSRLSRCVWIAFACTLAVHAAYEYMYQFRFGLWPGSYGASPRYYLPLWPGVAFGCAVAIGQVRRTSIRTIGAAAFLLLLAYGFPLVAGIRYSLRGAL